MKRTFLTLLITFWDIKKINNYQVAQNRAGIIGNCCRRLDLSFCPKLAFMEARKVALELFCKIPYSVDLGANRLNLGAS